jgi:hypothetical protein
MPHLQADGIVFIHFLLHYVEATRLHFIEQSSVDVFLHDALAQFLADGV